MMTNPNITDLLKDLYRRDINKITGRINESNNPIPKGYIFSHFWVNNGRISKNTTNMFSTLQAMLEGFNPEGYQEVVAIYGTGQCGSPKRVQAGPDIGDIIQRQVLYLPPPDLYGVPPGLLTLLNSSERPIWIGDWHGKLKEGEYGERIYKALKMHCKE